jgi:hypothetical protein
MYNKLFIIIMPVAVAILATILTLSTFTIPTFAQTAEEGVNQTMQDMGQSANQTGEAIQGNASDIGSKVTEGAKDVIGGIGEKLQDIGK